MRHVFSALAHLALAVFFLFPTSLFSRPQTPSTDEDLTRMRQMSLADLLETEISVTAHKAQTARDSAGIVSFVTAEEIRRSGARDLIDVLRMVQGFEFGVDVHGVVGLGFRGNWGFEGKILVQVDGQEFNELLYSSVPFGNHFPVDQIKRVEVIRGPGSVMYGGNAELAVINIITMGPEDLDGTLVHGTYGVFGDTYGRRDAGAVSAYRKGDFKLSAAAFFGQGKRSNRDYADINGDAYNLASASPLDPGMVNIFASYKGFSARFLMDRYLTRARDGWGVNYPRALANNFLSYFFDTRYEWQITPHLALTPQIQLKRQSPFNGTDAETIEMDSYYDIRTDRRLGRLSLVYDPSPAFSLLVGGEYRHDYAKSYGPASQIPWFSLQRRTLDYTNSAFFAQGSVHTLLADFTGGIRVEHHSQFGTSVVPRFAATRKTDVWHVKLLFAKAFRAPSILNIDYNPDIRPEKAYTAELETGVRLRKDVYLTANLFVTALKDTIVYINDAETGESTYLNFDETSTWGIEADLRWKNERVDLHGGYSWYRLIRNDADVYQVDGNPRALLAFPNHKLYLSATLFLAKHYSLNSSLTLLGKRWGYAPDGNGSLALESFTPKWIWSLYFLRENLFAEGLDLGVGLHDIGNSGYRFIQPYHGSHAPLPGPSREFIVKLAYRFGWGH